MNFKNPALESDISSDMNLRFIIHSSLFLILAITILALAAPPAQADVALPNPLGTTNVPVILGRLVAAMVGFAGAIGLLVFVYGGFQWLTAAGNPEKIKKGHDIMFWAIIGLVVMFGAYAATRYLIAVLTQGRVLL